MFLLNISINKIKRWKKFPSILRMGCNFLEMPSTWLDFITMIIYFHLFYKSTNWVDPFLMNTIICMIKKYLVYKIKIRLVYFSLTINNEENCIFTFCSRLIQRKYKFEKQIFFNFINKLNKKYNRFFKNIFKNL